MWWARRTSSRVTVMRDLVSRCGTAAGPVAEAIGSECAAAASSSGLVFPPGCPVRDAQVTGRSPRALLAGRIVPLPLACGPSQVVSAVRSAIAMAVLLPPRSACSPFPIARRCDPQRSCSLVLAPGDLDPPVVGAVFQVDEAVAARGEFVDPPPRGIRVSAGLQLHPLAVVQP